MSSEETPRQTHKLVYFTTFTLPFLVIVLILLVQLSDRFAPAPATADAVSTDTGQDINIAGGGMISDMTCDPGCACGEDGAVGKYLSFLQPTSDSFKGYEGIASKSFDGTTTKLFVASNILPTPQHRYQAWVLFRYEESPSFCYAAPIGVLEKTNLKTYALNVSWKGSWSDNAEVVISDDPDNVDYISDPVLTGYLLDATSTLNENQGQD